MSVHTEGGWAVAAMLLENGWPGAFDADRERAYRVLLASFEGQAVGGQPLLVAAIRGLCERGARFMPSAGEIAAECVRLVGGQVSEVDDTPSPAAVVIAAEAATYGEPGQSSAVARLGRECGPIAASWLASVGISRIKSVDLGPEAFDGQRNRRDLERDFAAHVERERGRLASGLPLLQVDDRGRIAQPERLRVIGRGDAA